MSLPAASVEEISARLMAAYASRSPIPPVTDEYPELTQDDAYRVQLATVQRWLAGGRRVVGKKIGLTSRVMQEMFGVDQPDYGHLMDDMVLDQGQPLETANLLQPRVEPEIAFVLATDLRGPGLNAARVLAATAFVLPAFEIIDSRIRDWKIRLCDTIADNASSSRVVVGPRPVRVDACDLRTVGVVFEKNGQVVATGAGAAVLDHPAHAVAWLGNRLAEYDVALRAGEIVLPGSICAAVPIGPGDDLRADFGGGLGSVSVRSA